MYTIYSSKTPGYYWLRPRKSFSSLKGVYSYIRRNNPPYWTLTRGSKESDSSRSLTRGLEGSDFPIASGTPSGETWDSSVFMDAEKTFYEVEVFPRQKLSSMGLTNSEIGKVLEDG